MHSYIIPAQLDTLKHHSDLSNRLQLDSVPEPYIYPLLLYNEPISICVIACDTSLLWARFAEQHWTVGNAFCPDQCCTAFLLVHCTPVWRANLHMCKCSDTSLLWACFPDQHWAVEISFYQNQCCSALVLGHCTPVWTANFRRCNCSDTSLLLCRAALSSGDCILPWTVLQCTGVGSLHTCMNSKST